MKAASLYLQQPIHTYLTENYLTIQAQEDHALPIISQKSLEMLRGTYDSVGLGHKRNHPLGVKASETFTFLAKRQGILGSFGEACLRVAGIKNSQIVHLHVK